MINDKMPLLIIINFDSKLQGSYCMPKVTQHQNIANTQIPSNSSEIPSKLSYACSEEGCNAEFRWKAWLDRHVKQVHRNIRPYVCPQCSDTFHVPSGLRNHVGAVHLKTKSHSCKYPQCSYTCFALKSLRRHIQIIHEKIKPFICTKCDKKFSTKANLHQHYTTKNHKTTNVQNKNLEIKANQTIMYDDPSKKRKLDNSLLTAVATTSNFNESSQADKTQEIYESQDILDLSIKKRELDNSSLTVEDASSNYDNKNVESSTTLADDGFLKALAYRNLVDTKETKPNFFKDCFWDRATGNLVEKDPAFVE
jgi:uncharacterized protein YlaI